MTPDTELAVARTDRTDTLFAVPTGRAGIRIHTLGGFGVTVGGTPITVPNGLPRQALKLAVIHGGQVHVEVVMEHLWPGTDLTGGRKGIRNILSRIGRVGLPLLLRDGEVLRIGDGVWVDAHAFQVLADRAVTAADPRSASRTARRALALYEGALLPDDRYVDWTVTPRRRLRRRRLAMLDILAADARRRGADTEAVQLMELALEDDPTDEKRYLDLVGLLIDLGRRGRAAELIDEAVVVLEELALAPDPAWAVLRRDLHNGRATGQRAGTTARTLTAAPTIFPEALDGLRANHHTTRRRQPPTGPNHRGGTS